jgi:5-methylcytosine-specific restriction endonuclease McrA
MTPFSSFSDKEKGALLHCYESQTNGLKKIKEAIRKTCNGPCPYCGIDGAREFDHYLPKTEFPEFSTLDLNLIACCGECNKKK